MKNEETSTYEAEIIKNCKQTNEVFLKFTDNDAIKAETLIEECFQEIYQYVFNKYGNIGIDLMQEINGDLYHIKRWLKSFYEGSYLNIEDFAKKYIKIDCKILDRNSIHNYINHKDYALKELIYPWCKNGKYITIGAGQSVHIFKRDYDYEGIF